MKISELKKVVLAATKGPWRLHTHHYPRSNTYAHSVVTDEFFGEVVAFTETKPHHDKEKDDATFISTFDPVMVMELLNTIEQLKEKVNELQDRASDREFNSTLLLGRLAALTDLDEDWSENWFAVVDAIEKRIEQDPAAAAIKYVLSSKCQDSHLEFLRCWTVGNFRIMREEWDDVPPEVFIGAEVV